MFRFQKIEALLARMAGVTSSDGYTNVKRVDPNQPAIAFFFTQVKGPPTTLAADVPPIGPTDLFFTVDVASAAGCTIGDYFGVFNADNPADNRAYFGTILGISLGGGAGGSDRITLDTPLDFEFVTGNTAACFTRELNVDGSTTPQIFSIQVGENATQSIKITRFMISMYTGGAPTLGEFGDQDSLTKGMVLRRVDGVINNIWNVKNNGELANITFDFDIYTAAGQGQDGAKWRNTYGGEDKHDGPIILHPGDSLQLIIQDAEPAAIQQFRVIGEGRYLEPGEIIA